jgi:hypothetical protein
LIVRLEFLELSRFGTAEDTLKRFAGYEHCPSAIPLLLSGKPSELESGLRMNSKCLSSEQVQRNRKLFLQLGLLALASAYLVTKVFHRFGLVFTGFDTFYVVGLATAGCLTVTAIVLAVVIPNLHLFRVVIVVCAVLIVLLAGRSRVRDHLAGCWIDPIPKDLNVMRGDMGLMIIRIYCTATPDTIASIIDNRQLVEASDLPVWTMWSARSRGWWMPTNMCNPRLFKRSHKEDSGAVWEQGVWIDGRTNEMFGYIIW